MLSRAGAWSGEVSESDGATAQAFTGPKDFGPLGRCTRIGVGARCDRFSTIDKRGRWRFRDPAHGLGKCLRAMARRGRRLPDLRISAPSVVARILVWARDATDSRPSINGGATVPVAAQRLRACWRAMAHQRRRFALLAIPLTPMLAHIWTRGDRRDRFSTIEKRRCDCAGGRAQAASVSAMAHRRSWFADFRDSVNSHFNLHPLLALTNATLISAH